MMADHVISKLYTNPRTVGARRQVWGATVDVSVMGTVAHKESEGGVWLTLG